MFLNAYLAVILAIYQEVIAGSSYCALILCATIGFMFQMYITFTVKICIATISFGEFLKAIEVLLFVT